MSLKKSVLVLVLVLVLELRIGLKVESKTFASMSQI